MLDYDYDYWPPARLRLQINKITMYSSTITITL